MTITVHGPDGSSFNFPDGTPQEKISTTLQAHYGPPKQKSALEKAAEPITSLSDTYQSMVRGGVERMGRGVEQIKSEKPWEMLKGAGNLAMGGLEYVGAPINAPLHTIVGKPVDENVSALAGPVAGGIAGTVAEIGAGFMLPAPHGLPREMPHVPASPYGITLSEGERTGDLAARQAEQEYLRNAGSHAQAWTAQRGAQIDQAGERLISNLDPHGGTVFARTGQEAGDVVSRGVQSAASTTKASVDAAYKSAREMPGEIHAGAFEGMPQQIKGDLTLGAEPVIIDEGTPNALKMINYLDGNIGKLRIKNAADPFGAPGQEAITGVSLTGVEQWRKALSAFRRDAMPGSADRRAANAVVAAFDKRIDQAVNGGMFSGDPMAIKAWNNARAAHTDYRAAFGGGGGNDPVGRVVQKIIGDRVNDPLTPAKVADQIVGSSGLTPSSLNIAVAKRVKTILGENSADWIAAKQGVLGRLIKAPEGMPPYGTGDIANRLSKFLNSDAASAIYSPSEIASLRGYANLMRKITMPKGSYFPSAPPIQRALSLLGNRVGQVIGALVGRTLTPGIPLIGEFAGITVGGKLEKALAAAHKDVRSQLPILGEKIDQWNKAQALLQSRPNPATEKAALGATLALEKVIKQWGIDVPQIGQASNQQQGGSTDRLAGVMPPDKIDKLNRVLTSNSPVAKQLAGPLDDWSKATAALQTERNARTSSRVLVAARNLVNNLKDAGIVVKLNDLLASVQGPAPASAKQKTQ